jgi:hypothetical protein
MMVGELRWKYGYSGPGIFRLILKHIQEYPRPCNYPIIPVV